MNFRTIFDLRFTACTTFVHSLLCCRLFLDVLERGANLLGGGIKSVFLVVVRVYLQRDCRVCMAHPALGFLDVKSAVKQTSAVGVTQNVRRDVDTAQINIIESFQAVRQRSV